MSDKVTIDGQEYSLDQLSEEAKANFASLKLVDQKIAEKQQELAILQTARNAYGKALNTHLAAAATEPDVSIS